MERIRIYYPHTKSLTFTNLSVLRYSEILELIDDIDNHFKKGTIEYHRSLLNIYRFILENHLHRLDTETTIQYKENVNTQKRTLEFIRDDIKVLQKKLDEERKREIKEVSKTLRTEKREKKVERIKNTLFINIEGGKKFRVKLEIEKISPYLQFNDLDLKDGKIVIDPKKKIKYDDRYLNSFFHSLEKKKQSYLEFILYIPVYIYLILLLFNLRLEYIELEKNKENKLSSFILYTDKDKISVNIKNSISDVFNFSLFLLYKKQLYNIKFHL